MPHDDADDALARDVSFLGRVLGDVLREQGGDTLFDAVEGLRQACRHMRHHDCEAARREIEERVEGLPLPLAGDVVRAFTLYFHLINMAEENHRLRRLAAGESSRYPAPRNESIDDAISNLAQSGLPAPTVSELLRGLDIRPVFTAHPTEARRMTLLRHLRRIAQLVDSVGSESHSPSRRADLTRRLYAEVTDLWQTNELRERQQTVLDEARNGLYYFDSSVFDVTAQLNRDMRDAVMRAYPEIDTHGLVFLTYGSWIGGDRDGNPNVTPTATEETLRLHKALVLSKYLAAIRRLFDMLTASSALAGASSELYASIEADTLAWGDNVRSISERFPDQPYRQKLHLVAARLQAAYIRNGAHWPGFDLDGSEAGEAPVYDTAEQLLQDLELVQCSLRDHGAERQADDALQDLIWQVRTFGFHLARLDIRQHRDRHDEAVQEILALHGGEVGYKGLDERNRARLLTEALETEVEPLDLDRLSPGARETVEVFRVIARMQDELGQEAIDTYIVSFTQGASDLLAVLYLARVAGLVRLDVGESRIRVVPLFETGEDLE
ncbi:MAG TPA: phosphoenolpyruvate carboxylase, partial [Chloroflexota bacterium]